MPFENKTLLRTDFPESVMRIFEDVIGKVIHVWGTLLKKIIGYFFMVLGSNGNFVSFKCHIKNSSILIISSIHLILTCVESKPEVVNMSAPPFMFQIFGRGLV